MSDSSKRKDPNATIQIDLDQVQLYDPNATPDPGASEGHGRKVPPPLPLPLPPSASLPGIAQAAAPNPARTIALVAMFVVLIGLAIVGGLMVGTRGKGGQITPAPSATTAAVASPSAVPSTSAAPATLTLPTIEMR